MRRRAAASFFVFALAALLVACSDADSDAANSSRSPAADADAGATAVADAGSATRTSTHASRASTSGDADAGITKDAGHDGATIAECYSPAGGAGTCMAASACSAITDRTPTPTSAHCAVAGDECCVDTPDTADNPPIPAGHKLLTQSQVTPEMTTWAVSILHDPATYPMFATVTRTFGALLVLARVEWHPPDFQNNAIHRGVTLYEPI